MFDTQIIGNKIAELRKKNNMTQFELADKLGISFQAVSNWERGNSMPDISKLPQIAELFNTTIYNIIGKPNRVLNEISEGRDVNISMHTSEEINDAAGLIQPQTIKEIIEHSTLTFKLSSLLPYLECDYIEQLTDKYYQQSKDISIFLPFLSSAKIKVLLKHSLENDKSINAFLPYLPKEDIHALAEKFIAID